MNKSQAPKVDIAKSADRELVLPASFQVNDFGKPLEASGPQGSPAAGQQGSAAALPPAPELVSGRSFTLCAI